MDVLDVVRARMLFVYISVENSREENVSGQFVSLKEIRWNLEDLH